MKENRMSPSKKFGVSIAGFLVLISILTVIDSSIDGVDIPFIPDLTINGIQMPRIETGRPLSSSDMLRAVLTSFPSLKASDVTLADRLYQEVTLDSFKEFASFLGRFYWTSPDLVYRPESYDCDNFARAAVVIADLATPGITGQMAFCRIYVHHKVSWGGVPSGGNHALCGFVANGGIFIYEPQSGRIDSVNNYPNKDYVFKLTAD